jgi:hypothetical protein
MEAIASLSHDSLRADARVNGHLRSVAAQDASADVRRRAQAALDDRTKQD